MKITCLKSAGAGCRLCRLRVLALKRPAACAGEGDCVPPLRQWSERALLRGSLRYTERRARLVRGSSDDGGGWMATHEQVTSVLNILVGQMLACPDDGTRLRYGDYECPHCGADLEDHLRAFAAIVADAVLQVPKG